MIEYNGRASLGLFQAGIKWIFINLQFISALILAFNLMAINPSLIVAVHFGTTTTTSLLSSHPLLPNCKRPNPKKPNVSTNPKLINVRALEFCESTQFVDQSKSLDSILNGDHNDNNKRPFIKPHSSAESKTNGQNQGASPRILQINQLRYDLHSKNHCLQITKGSAMVELLKQ